MVIGKVDKMKENRDKTRTKQKKVTEYDDSDNNCGCYHPVARTLREVYHDRCSVREDPIHTSVEVQGLASSQCQTMLYSLRVSLKD